MTDSFGRPPQAVNGRKLKWIILVAVLAVFAAAVTAVVLDRSEPKGKAGLPTASTATTPSEPNPTSSAVASSIDTAKAIADRRRQSEQICHKGKVTPNICGRISAKKRNILVLGDSLGWDGVNMISQMDPQANILFTGVGGCPPFRDLTGYEYEEGRCPKINAQRLPEVASLATQVDTIFISGGVPPDRVAAMADTVTWLHSLGAHVVVNGLAPIYSESSSVVVQRDGADKARGTLWSLLLFHDSDNLGAKAATEAAGGVYLDRFDTVCANGSCVSVADGMPVVLDSVHMTYEGATWLGGQLAGQSALLWP